MRGQIRKRGKSWSVVIYLGRDAETGGERRKWYTHPTRHDAEAHLAQLLVQIGGGGGAPPSRLLTRDFFDRWLRDGVHGRLAPTTEAIYAYAVRRYLGPRLGLLPIARVTAPAIQSCLGGMLAKGLSPATVHQVYRAANTALRTAVRWGILVRNPCEFVDPPRVDVRPATIWDEEQVQLFLAEAQRSSSHYVLYLTIILTGARPGEALALRWRSVNLVVGEIVLREKLYRLGRRHVWGATKTHRHDAVPVPQLLAGVLAQHRQDQNRWRARLGDGYDDQGLVFAQPNGRPLHARNLYRRDFTRLARRAGLPHIRLYDLRHCHATCLAESGVPVHILQRQLGHKSAAVTMRYYVHPLRDARAAVDALATRLLEPELEAAGSRR